MKNKNYKVIKRNGTAEPFTPDRIRVAIRKAVIASHTQDELKDFSNQVLEKLTSDVVVQIKDIFEKQTNSDIKTIDINVIQDIVERTLIKNGFADTAKAYILYRRKRDEIRSTRDSISKTISDVLMSDSKDSDTKRENGNVDGNTAMGTMLQVGSNVTKNFYVNNMMSKDIAKAYTEGYIHIHDLDFYSTTLTCCQIDFKKLAEGGFNTGHGHLREPQSIGSYATLAAIAIQSNQNDMFGGQSIPNFDYSMTQGIYKSFRKAWKRNVEKAIEFGLLNKDDFTLVIHKNKDITTLTDNDEYKYVRISNIFDEEDELIESVLCDKKDYQYFNKEKTGDCLDEQLYKIIDMTKKDVERECYQAMEGFVHNLNTLHSRAGAQVK